MIRLFPSGAVQFETNGLGALSEAVNAVVTEERNGIFELTLEYPMTGRRFNDIDLNKIIVCKTNPYSDEPQAFRIYSIAKPINGIITVYAQHISYDLIGHVLPPFNTADWKEYEGSDFDPDDPRIEDGDVMAAVFNYLNAMDKRVLPTDGEGGVTYSNFTFRRDIKSEGFDVEQHIYADVPQGIRSILGGSDASILSVYGGELEFDNRNVILHDRRGVNRGVRIRYGKNMTDINRDASTETCYTGVFPFYKYYSEGTAVVKILNHKEQYPYDPIVPIPSDEYYDPDFFATNVNIFPLDFSDRDIDTSGDIEEQLRTLTAEYILVANLGHPSFNIRVDYQPLSDSPEYEAYKALEEVRLCDYVTVEHDTLGIRNEAMVTKIEYDVLKNRYSTLELVVNSEKVPITKTIAKMWKDSELTESLSNDVEKSKSDVSDIKDDLDGVKSNVSGLNTDVSSMRVDVGALGDDFAVMSDNIEGIASDLDDVADDLEKTQEQVEAMDMKVSGLEMDIDNVSNTAERAESKADNAVARQRTLYSNSSSSSPKTVDVNGYEELSYIKSDGESALDLGLEAGSNLGVEVVLNSKWKSDDDTEVLFGFSKIGYFYALRYDRFNYANKSNNTYSVHGKKYKVTNGKLYVDDNEVVTLSGYTFGTKGDAAPVYFGGDYYNGSPRRYTVVEFKRINADLGSGNKREFVPMLRASDNAIGFYELTTKTFHKAPNGWTAGKFVGVPPIPDNPQTSWEIPDVFKKYWSETPPSPEANTLYYTCVETQLNNGFVYYSEPMEDKNGSVLLSWCKNADMTVIDGGMIAANTIAADKIIANDLMAKGIETGVLASREFIESGGMQGMAIDLTTGQIISNNGAFMVNALGQMFSTAGRIGSFEVMPDGSLRAVYRKEPGGEGYEANQVFELTTYTSQEARAGTTYRLWIGTDTTGSYIADQLLAGIELSQWGVTVYEERVIKSGAGSVRIMYKAVYSSSNVRYYSSTFDASRYLPEVDPLVYWRRECLDPDTVDLWDETMDLAERIDDFEDRISRLES